jgi:predicted small lipoprotein YifL
LEIRVPRPSDRSLVRLAKTSMVIAALIAALGLAGCGRKGPLEAPPSALVPGPAVAAEEGAGPTAVQVAPAGGGAQAPLVNGYRPSRRSFILDPLLY